MTELINKFEPITLAEMSSVKLMNRTDTKFVTNLQKLIQLLEMAQQDYYVQDIDGGRNLEYDTTYFDTQTFDMYCVHQHGHTNRQKIRFRTYCVSGLQFMEIKTKNNHGRTKKKRIEVGDMDLADEEKRQFIGQHLRYGVDTLQPALNNHFSRITLVNKAKTERLTIDSGLRFHNLQNDQRLDDAVAPKNTFREDIRFLLKKYHHLPIQRMGFFDGWDREPMWKSRHSLSARLHCLVKSFLLHK